MPTLYRWVRLHAAVCAFLCGLTSWGQLNQEGLYVPVEIGINYTASIGTTPLSPAEVFVVLGSSSLYDNAPKAGYYFAGNLYASIKPGKEYYISSSGSSIDSSELRVNVTSGWRVLIDEVEQRRVVVPGLGALLKFRIERDTQLAMGESTELRAGRVIWELGVGSLRGGGSAGNISLRESGISALTFKPDVLDYDCDETVVEIYRPGGILRQILSDQCLVDIDALNGWTYYIRFYQRIDVGSKSGSLWQVVPGAQPIYEYTVTNPDHPALNRVRITKTTKQNGYSKTWWTELVKTGSTPTWTATDWTDTSLGTVGASKREWVMAGFDRDETLVVKSGTGAIASNTRTLSTNYFWGDSVTQQTLGDGLANPETTTYAYDSTGTSGVGKMTSIVKSSGEWTKYEYYTDTARRGMVHRTYEPYLNSPSTPAGASPFVGKVQEFDYVSDWTGLSTLPSSIVTKINDVQVGKTLIAYVNETKNGQPLRVATRKDYSDATNYVQTVTKTYREDADELYHRLPGKIHSVIRPDGTMRVTLYVRGNVGNPTYREFIPDPSGSLWREISYEGTSVSTGGVLTTSISFGAFGTLSTESNFYLVPGRSVSESTTFAAYGRPLWREKQIYTSSGWVSIEFSESYFASTDTVFPTHSYLFYGAGNPLGVIASYEWKAGQLDAKVDATGARFEYAYDNGGRLVREARKAKSGQPQAGEQWRLLTLDGAGRVLTERLQNGAGASGGDIVKSFAYDTAGRLTGSTEPGPSGGLTSTITHGYGGNPRIARIVYPGGGDRITEVNLDGTLAGITGSAQVPQHISYSVETGGIQVRQSRQSGASPGVGWSEMRFDWLGRTVGQTLPNTGGGTIRESFNYNAAGQLGSRIIQNGFGATQLSPYLFVYDSMGGLLREGLDLNEDGTLTSASASNDRVTEYQVDTVYDGGAWWTQKDTKVYYDYSSAASSRVSRSRVRLTGLSATLLAEVRVIDGNNNVLATTTTVVPSTATITTESQIPGSTTSSRKIEQNGFPKEERSSRGEVVSFAYDAFGRPVSTQGRSNVKEDRVYYDGTRFIKNLRNQYLHPGVIGSEWQEFVYDAAGRVSEHKVNDNGDWKSAYYSYSTQGKLNRQWGPRVEPVEYSYDSYGRLSAQTTYRSGVHFESSSWPGSPPTGDLTQWQYDDPTNLLISKTDAKLKAVAYTYDALNRVATRTWARGATTTYTYRSSYGQRTGEIESRSYAGDPAGLGTATVTYAYARDGRVGQIDDGMGQRLFSYRSVDRLLESELLPTTFGLDASSNKRTLTYKYDGTIPGRFRGYQLGFNGDDRSLRVTYGFDTGTGRISTIDAAWRYGLNDSQQTSTTSYTYEPGSSLVKTVTQGNLVKTATWQNWRNLQDNIAYAWSGASRAEFTYDYDWLERRVGEKVRGTLASDFSYPNGYRDWNSYSFRNFLDGLERRHLDASGAPVGAFDTTRQRDWTYDGQGNRTQEVRTAGTSTFSPNEVNQYTGVTGWGAEAFTHDFDGNLTSDNIWSYYYDGENRLAWMVKKDNSQNIQFGYDYAGRRSQKVIRSGATLAGVILLNVKLVYQGWRLLAEISGPMPADSIIRSYVWGLDNTNSVGGGGGVGGLLQINAAGVSGGTFLVISSANGNVRGLIDRSTGALSARYDYSSFGELIALGGDPIASDNPFRFASKYVDYESGLADYNHRVYNARTGRFLTRDPIEELGGANLYAYANNDPAGSWDYLGLYAKDADGSGEEPRKLPAVTVETTRYKEKVYGTAGGGPGAGGPGLGLGLLGPTILNFTDNGETVVMETFIVTAPREVGKTYSNHRGTYRVTSARMRADGFMLYTGIWISTIADQVLSDIQADLSGSLQEAAEASLKDTLNGATKTGTGGPNNPGTISAYRDPGADWGIEGGKAFLRGFGNTLSALGSAIAHPIDAYRSFTTIREPLTPYGSKLDNFLLSTKMKLQSPYGRGSLMADIAVMRGASLAGPTVSAFRGGLAGEGTQLFRVFGDEARGLGQYYTTTNPGAVANFRETAGLFPGNSGQFLLQGTLNNTEGVIFRSAAPGPGGVGGGLPEVFVPRPGTQINITNVSGVNPPF
ncbi:MAG: RHS repeat-associated core domain-containing protein [Opitutaceae bacterium]|nr:RHS repeat-associated core domain-containing protein [Opitutaceae bacterium]